MKIINTNINVSIEYFFLYVEKYVKSLNRVCRILFSYICENKFLYT